jgi:hypothetical protein
MHIDTISLVQRKIKKNLQQLKDHAIYGVDTMRNYNMLEVKSDL